MRISGRHSWRALHSCCQGVPLRSNLTLLREGQKKYYCSVVPKDKASVFSVLSNDKRNSPNKPTTTESYTSGSKTTFFLDHLHHTRGNAISHVHPCGDHIRVYVDASLFAWIVLDQKGRSANALGESFLRSASIAFDYVDTLVAQKKVQMAIITSAKDTFCVGADIDQLYPLVQEQEAFNASQVGQEFFNRVERSKYTVLVAIHGLALGGGCELALACHHRILASETGKLGLPETLLGLLPGAGGTVRLPKLVGVQAALKMILTGAPQSADRCKKMGLVDIVLPSKDRFEGEYRFLRGVRTWAMRYIDRPVKPSTIRPISWSQRFLEHTSLGLYIIQIGAEKMLHKQTKGKYIGHYKALGCVLFNAKNNYHSMICYRHESKQFASLLMTPEAKNQIALYFLDDGMKKIEKKTTCAIHTLPKVSHIGVIGAGVMGSGIAHIFTLKDYAVYLRDVQETSVQKGLSFIEQELHSAMRKKKMDSITMQRRRSRVQGGVDLQPFHQCDVILEAAVEVMDIKKKMIVELETAGILNGSRIFATNTSSLSITELQSVSKYPHNIVGMHFFNPVAKMPLIEIIQGKQTSPMTIATIYQLALKIGKKPIVVQDGPGFVVNRILGAYMSEAARIVRDGVHPYELDQCIKQFGFPMGPLRLLDEVGLDIACHVGPILENGLRSKRFAIDPALIAMVQDGYLGKKNKKGIYTFDEKGKEGTMNVALVQKYFIKNSTLSSESITSTDIIHRCLFTMINEASYILEEKICQYPEDIDIGMIWGTGFAPFRGGLLQYADHIGLETVVQRMEELQTKYESCLHLKPSTYLKQMVAQKKRFYPDRPYVPYVERKGFPSLY